MNFLNKTHKYLKMCAQKSFGTTCDISSSYSKNKLIYSAATRNKEPILEVFKKVLEKFSKNEKLFLLEVSSGSGQHVAHFAPYFPHVTFQPSEYEADLLGSISMYAEECQSKNIKPPILLDICQDLAIYGFKNESIDIIYNANLMHISPYECTTGLFANAGKYLRPNGIMITYGPYAMNGSITPQSNVDFDKSLRYRNPLWGLRDIQQDLSAEASKNNLILKEIIDMPSNNKCLIWVKN